MKSEIKKALEFGGMGEMFLVKAHPKFSNLCVVMHNAERASAGHVLEDLHAAEITLRNARFESSRAGYELTVRREIKRPSRGDDYDTREGQYAGAYDIEIGDLC